MPLPRIHSRLNFTLGLVALLFLISLASTALGKRWQGTETKQDGAVHVMNPAEPMEGERRLGARELWRLGGESEDDAEIFGRVDEILVDEDGLVYVLDSQLSEVRVFSPDGEYLRTLGGEGEGPGLFRNAMGMCFLPGDRIGITQMMPARIAVVGRQGEGYTDMPLPQRDGAMMSILERVRSRGDRVTLSQMMPIMADGGLITSRALLSVDPQGAVQATYRSEENRSAGGQLSISSDDREDYYSQWELAADGSVWVAPHYDRFRIYQLGENGVQRVIERDYESVKRSRDEIEELEEEFASIRRPGGVTIESDVDPFRRDIDAIYPRPDGSLWVISSRSAADRKEGEAAVFEVYDEKGRYQRRVRVPAEFDIRYDQFLLRGDKLFVLKEANSAPDMTASSGGGGGHGMMMVVRRSGPGGGGDEDLEDRAALPFEIICYDLNL